MLFDANGKILQTKTVNTIVKIASLQMLGYSAGTYYVIVKDASGKTLQSIKIIKADQ